MFWLEKRAKFCEEKCPVCKKAREGNKIAKWFVKNIDRKICPFCRAYEKVNNKKAHK